MKLSGTCLCGDVGFELDGWVSPIQACHAERCRKATGGLFAPEIAASAAALRWRGKQEQIATYEAPILNGPPAYRRNFCRNCGSPLPVILEEAGILDEGATLPVFRHAFVGQKSGCCDISDGKPQFVGQPPPPAPGDSID